MTWEGPDTPAAPIAVRDILLLLLEADKYPRLGNEDWRVANRMAAEALQKAEAAVSSPDDPPEFARWLEALQKPNLTVIEREEVLWSMHDYFAPHGTP